MPTQYKMSFPGADRMRLREIECGHSDLTLSIHHTTHALTTAHTSLVALRNAVQNNTTAADGFLDSRAHTNDPESITDPMF